MFALVLKRLSPWLLLVLAGLAAAWARYGLIEQPAMAAACAVAHPSALCQWRQLLVVGFLHDVYGVAGLAVAALALWRHSRALAWLAAALGIVALELYNFEPGAVALLAGCLRLVHLQARAAKKPKAVPAGDVIN
ncbi:MAG TPA: hypothetical protein VF271_01960 [Rhodanobacteraceae bacterium]